jgi:hypothetical protein
MAYDGRLSLGTGINYKNPKNVLANPFEYSQNNVVDKPTSGFDNMHRHVIQTQSDFAQ